MLILQHALQQQGHTLKRRRDPHVRNMRPQVYHHVHGDKQLEKVKDFTCQINENDIKQEMEINNYIDRKICYKCDKCNKVTRQYFCLKCSKGYSRKSGVNQHMKTAHETEKPDILDDVKCNDSDEEINTKMPYIGCSIKMEFT